MTDLEVVTIGREMIMMALLVAAPLLGFGLIIGLVISIFQAMTQVNEMTLTFVPKIVGVGLALGVFLPWILDILTSYTINLMEGFSTYIQ